MNAYKNKEDRHRKPAAPQETVPSAQADGATSPWAFRENFLLSGKGLIYGRGDKRGQYREEVDQGVFKNTLFAIDTYNNAVSGNAVNESEHNMALLERFMNAKESKKKEIVKKIEIPENLHEFVLRRNPDLNWPAYFDVGKNNTKFNIAAIYKEAAQHYGDTIHHDFAPGLTPKLLWKRGSKLGIEMAAQNATNIHFVLDGVDMDAVANKKGSIGEAITSSELRYAYRNRERLEGRLFFYRNKKRVKAPWDADPTLWANRVVSSGAGKTGLANRIRNMFRKQGK